MKKKISFLFGKEVSLYKRAVQLLLILSLLIGVVCKIPRKQQDVFPVILLVNRYPLTDADKKYFKNINPYGFLLSIPIHQGLRLSDLKQELEVILERKDFLFFLDQEGGAVNRIRHFNPDFKAPSPQSFGFKAKVDLPKAVSEVYQYGLRTAEELKKLSIDVAFAPLAEAAEKKEVYGRIRYFSEDPEISTPLADAFAKGLTDGGITPCYKHFPGTPTNLDPHLVKQVIDTSLEDLKTKYTRPFAQAYKYPCLMTAHATYTAIDKRNISTYSPAFYRFTRKALNYDGIIIPDALNMQAADGHNPHTIGWRMNKALAAGADVVMPFFAFSADPQWMEEQIRQIRPQYIKRFQKKLKLIKRAR